MLIGVFQAPVRGLDVLLDLRLLLDVLVVAVARRAYH